MRARISVPSSLRWMKNSSAGGAGADGPVEGAQQIAHPPLEDVVAGAGPLRPEAVPLVVRPAQHDGHALGGRLRLEQTTEMHTREAWDPEVAEQPRVGAVR